jgi:hypothetical protein
MPVGKPGKFVPDEYDIELADLIRPWKELASADIGIVGVPSIRGS